MSNGFGEQFMGLQQFKEYVHNRLDTMGVPELNEIQPCRVGARLDWLETKASQPTIYQDFVLTTEAPPDHTMYDRLRGSVRELHALIGLTTEVGELADAFKRWIYYGKPEINRVNVIEELGDLEWYLALMRNIMGVSQEEVQRVNKAKLQKRYDKLKFDAEQALNRDVAGEQKLMGDLLNQSTQPAEEGEA